MNDNQTSSGFSPALPIGTMLGQYAIQKVIGSGGFGITYLAQDETTNELVVIKENYPSDVSFRNITSLTIGPTSESNKESYEWALARFQDEAKILSSLCHPNIVPIRHAFKALGTAYYVMPHVEGIELNKAAPAPDNITAAWLQNVLVKILSALDHVHAQGLIHRDIKPRNILLRADGEPIIIDFGTARALESTHSHTHIGTPGFMPLEQFSAKGKRGPWTDIYALGATCYNLITGEMPPASTDRTDEDEYQPLANRPTLADRFPEHILSSIDKALCMKRQERWQSAQEWMNALNGVHSPITGSKRTSSAKSLPSSSKKKRKNLTILSIFLLAALGGGLCYNYFPRSAKPPAKQEHSTLCTAARDGDVEKVRLLLEAGSDVNKADSDSQTPLIWAARNGHAECAQLLLNTPGIDVNKADKNGFTPLLWATRNGHTECVQLLRNTPGIAVNEPNQNSTLSPSLAEATNHTDHARIIHTASEQFNNSLHAAAREGDAEKVSLLLASGADVNKVDEHSIAPLIWAANLGHTECVRLLLTAPGIEVNTVDKSRCTPLVHAALNGHTECVRLLLNAPGIDVNKENQDKRTPLHAATFNGHTECVRLLLKVPEIELNTKDVDNSTPLIIAAHNGHAECVKLLLTAPGTDVNASDNPPLLHAALHGHTECVRLLINAPGIDVNRANPQGGTPLIAAAFKGHTECVRLLINAPGIEVDKAGQNNTTALSIAEAAGHTECARLIREAGGQGQSNASLSDAARDGDIEAVRRLLASGADVNMEDKNGFTPLHAAAFQGHTECVRLLLAAPGIDVNQENENGWTPLVMAVHNGHTECLKLLLSAPGIDVNTTESPLTYAAYNNRTECMRILLKVPGIDVNKANPQGGTPLHAAAYQGHTECVRLLLNAPGIDVNQTGENGATPLTLAESAGHTECARLIRAAGGR